jgi:hypothetical protein
MNWSTLRTLTLLLGAVCLISCAPRNRSAAQIPPIPDASSTGSFGAKQPSNGIYVERVKVYDEAALEGLLNAAKANLAQLNGFDQTSLVSHLGAIQGSTATQSQSALQITAQPGVTPGTATPNNPALPAPSATFTLPSTFQTSASDFLNEQLQLSLQMVNLQLLLSGSLNDQFEQASNTARVRTTLGFPININVPPGFKYQEAVAEVEVSLCAPDGASTSDLTLVTLLPQEKTYNVASLVSKGSSISGGAIAGIVNVGGGVLRSRQTYYLVQDQDTLAIQRFPQTKCAREGSQPDSHLVTFAWQFRPVLGQKVVRDGLRQTFAQISFSQDQDSRALHSLPMMVRTGWRHYDSKTGRVGNEIDPFQASFLKADRFDILPVPGKVQAADNGDGTVTVVASGAFRAGTRVRIGGVVQDNSTPGFEQNQRYIRFIASASPLALYGARLLNQSGTEADLIDSPPNEPFAFNVNGDGTVTVSVLGLFSATASVQVGGIPQKSLGSQNLLRFTTAASSLAKYGAYVYNGNSEAAAVYAPPGKGSPAPAPKIEPFDLKTVREGETLTQAQFVGSGTHFRPGLTDVAFSPAAQIAVRNIHVVDDTHLYADLVVAPTAPPGPTEVTIVTDAEVESRTDFFTVQGIARVEPFNDSTSLVKLRLPLPSDTSVTPESAGQPSVVVIGNHVFGLRDAPFYGQTDDEISVLITNDLIRTNRQVVWKKLFTLNSQTYPIIFPPAPPTGVSDFAITGVTLVSYTAGSPAPGSSGASVASNVTITTASETATGAGLFTIGSGAPTITAVSQASGQPGEALKGVTVTGNFTHFTRRTPTVTFSNSGISASNLVVLDDTHFKADLVITAGATKGISSVTVVTGYEIAIGVDLFNGERYVKRRG